MMDLPNGHLCKEILTAITGGNLLSADDTQEGVITSKIINLDGTNSQTLLFKIPSVAYVNSGIISISSDADGFDSSVTLSIAGSSQTISPNNDIFYNILNPSQISGSCTYKSDLHGLRNGEGLERNTC